MDYSKGSEAFAFMGDLFSFMKNTSELSESSEYWEKVYNQSEVLMQEYGKTPSMKRLAWYLIKGYLDFLESELKNEQV